MEYGKHNISIGLMFQLLKYRLQFSTNQEAGLASEYKDNAPYIVKKN
jgi:hypothetical protein